MWRNEEQVRRLRHLHLKTGFGTALWVATYPFDNWDGLRTAATIAFAAYLVTVLCFPAYTGRQRQQKFFWMNVGVWMLLVAAAVVILIALVWHQPLSTATPHDGLPGFAGTALLIFVVQLGLVIAFAATVIVMAVRGRSRPSSGANRASHHDDPSLPRALGNCSAIVLAPRWGSSSARSSRQVFMSTPPRGSRQAASSPASVR